jgi:hypothetical protein
MKHVITIAILLSTTSAMAEQKWTHLPDGRWMFVDPNDPPKSAPSNSQMCDFEHHCYGGEESSPSPTAVLPPSPSTNLPPSHLLSQPQSMPKVTYNPEPDCWDMRQGIFPTAEAARNARIACGDE